MQRVAAYLLGLLFSGGTVLAAGSALSSLKRSMSRPMEGSQVDRTSAIQGPSPPQSMRECDAIPKPALAASPLPRVEPAETPKHSLSQVADPSRAGKKKKRTRLGDPSKREQKKAGRANPKSLCKER
jgi:hypothetical protein